MLGALQKFQGSRGASRVPLIALEGHVLLPGSEVLGVLSMKYYQIIIVQRRSVLKASVSKENVKKESALLVIAHIGAIAMSVLLRSVNLDLVHQEHARLVLAM